MSELSGGEVRDAARVQVDASPAERGLRSLTGDEVLAAAHEMGLEGDGDGCRLLAVWLGHRLGYSSLLRGPDALGYRTLRALLRPSVFERLDAEGRRVLEHLARTSASPFDVQMTLRSALATLALWRHASRPDRRQQARRRLLERALPDDLDELDRLAGYLYGAGAEHAADPPGLYALAAIQLEGGYSAHAARLAGLYLARRFGPWRAEDIEEAITVGCDRAATRHLEHVADWIQLMAEAGVDGTLRFSWLERPVRAAIRLSVEDGERYRRLVRYHRRRLYETDRERLEDLYGDLLDRCFAEEPDLRRWASRQLLREVRLALDDHPKRSLRLLELRAIHEYPLHVGSFQRRIEYATRHVADRSELTIFDRYLAGLYVETHDIDPYAQQYVADLADRLDWTAHPVTDREALERYLQLSDYDRAFADLRTEYGGTTLQMSDADAAADVRYFAEKRLRASSVTRFVDKLMRPTAWIGSALVRTDPIQQLFERGVVHLESHLRDLDLERYVVGAYREAGMPLESFDEIASLNTDFIDDLLETARRRSVALGTLAGSAAGGLGALRSEVLSLADVPVVLAICIDISSRFCWFYGFDPREHPDIPVEILAVALQGPSPSLSEPAALRSHVSNYAIQTSLWVEAAASRNLRRIAGRAVRGLSDMISGGDLSREMARAGEDLIEAQFDARRGADDRPFSLTGALLGGMFDATLVYDVLEAARIVLMDRFLERKYPGWTRQVG